jgi:antitoxin YefM
MTRLPVVKATNVTHFRNHLKQQFDKVLSENVTLIVTRSDDRNIVVLSETEYEMLITQLNNLTYHLKLLESAQQAVEGQLITIGEETLESMV